MTNDSGHVKMETTVPMKLFEDLASVSQKQRIAAVEKIESHLLKKASGGEKADSDVVYTIKRLVRGLASNRKLARVGFATALANCLSKECVPLSDTLASLSDPTSGGQFLKTTGTMGKADRTQTIIGQLFFVATITKGALSNTKKIGINDITKLTTICADAFKQKPILRQMACSILGQLVSVVAKDEESASEKATAIFKVLQPLLAVGWPTSSSDIDAADLLLLALVAEPIVPFEFWTESSWLSSETAQSRQSFIYSLLSDPGKVAAAIVSARQTPFVHLAAVKLLDSLSSQLSHRKMRKRFFNFWSELVNERLLLPGSSVSHKTAALQLAVVTLTTFLRQTPSLIPVVLSTQMIELLSSGLRRTHCREREAVLAFFDEVTSGFSQKKESGPEGESTSEANENYHLTILACLMRPPIRVWHDFATQFDKMLRASPPSTLAQISEIMKSIAVNASFLFNYNYEKTGEDDETGESHRWEDESAALAARRWAVAHLASNLALSSPAQSSDDIVSVISTIFDSCLFVDKKAGEFANGEPKAGDEGDRANSNSQKIGLFPREQAVNFVLRAVCAATSPGIAEHLAGTSECIGLLKSALSSLKKRILSDEESDYDSTQSLVISPITGDAKKAFLSLLKILKKKTTSDSVLELLRLFACHTAVLLACYPNDKEIIQSGNEINDLFSSVAESDDGDASNEGPARVFLDMLISLLSRKSRPIRQVTTSMFAKLIANRKLFGLLTSSSNADSDTQASSLVDLIVNALLNTQFVEDGKDSEEDEDHESSGSDVPSEDEGHDDYNNDGVDGKKLKKSKRKRTASGHIVSSTAPVNNDENDPNNNDDNASSVDSMMNDEEMFALDSVFAAAVKAATAGGGPAKRAKKERKNQLQQMKEFHMKLASWLEMVVQKGLQVTGDDPVCNGNKILVDVVGILMNTLSSKKKKCSPAIEIRFCEIIRMAITPWRQSKAIEDGSIDRVAKALSSSGEMILDSCLQIVRNISANQVKLETAALVVELLLLCSGATDSPAIKSKSIIAALQNSLEAYLVHPSPHGHVFFSLLLSSVRLPLKQLERVFFDRLLQCLAGKESGSKQEEDEKDGDDRSSLSTSTKTKSFPRSQAARLLANSQLVTMNAYNTRPRICQELGNVLDEMISSFVSDVDEKDEKEDKKEPLKSIQQPWLYRNVVELVKRHVNAVLASASNPEERARKLESFAQLAANIEKIRDNSLGKKLADIRQACCQALKILKKKIQAKKEAPAEVKKEAKPQVVASGKKRRNESKSDDATPEKMSHASPTETPSASSETKEKSKKKTTHHSG